LWQTGCLGAPLEYLNFEKTGPGPQCPAAAARISGSSRNNHSIPAR
jgi:hypothetical protein